MVVFRLRLSFGSQSMEHQFNVLIPCGEWIETLMLLFHMVESILLFIQIRFLCLMDEELCLNLFCRMGHLVLRLLSCLMMPLQRNECVLCLIAY